MGSESFRLIDNDEELIALTERLLSEGKSTAVDFEEECNLHVYGEHISIIQIYDGTDYYIVDVLADGITKKGLTAFFMSDLEKVWFECKSDLSILWKKHRVTAKNVFDLRVIARTLGFDGGLDKLLERNLGIVTEGKKKHQRENWMIRPLQRDMLEYALGDVAHLFDLKESLLSEVEEKKLKTLALKNMKGIEKVSDGKPGWAKICNIALLAPEERIYLRNIFNARESIAERFNVPAVRVLEKKEIVRLAKKVPATKEVLMVELSSVTSPRFRAILIDKEWAAIEKSRKEIAEGVKIYC